MNLQEPKEILIKKEQFIPIMKMFLEDIVNDMLSNRFSEKDLFNGINSFRVYGVILGDRLDINEHTGNLYPHFDVYYEGYLNQYNRVLVGTFIIIQIEKYFSNLNISSTSSFRFLQI